jgi:hypothetical protein
MRTSGSYRQHQLSCLKRIAAKCTKLYGRVILMFVKRKKLKMPKCQNETRTVSASPTLIPMQTPLLPLFNLPHLPQTTTSLQCHNSSRTMNQSSLTLQFFSPPFYLLSKPSSKCPLISRSKPKSKCNQYGKRNLNIQHIVEHHRGAVTAV